jgi:dihydrodipicolinate synthase/N-acetylneuraminate lyase
MASLRFCGDKIAVIGASEPNRFIMHHFMLGIPAVWLGLAGALPELVVGIHKAVVKGDMDSAKALSDKLATYVDLYMCEYPDYIRYYKACVALRGLPAGPTRPPLLPLSPENMNKARMTLRKIGIL